MQDAGGADAPTPYLSRRRVLLCVGAAGASATFAGPAAAWANTHNATGSAETMTVWRLDPDWGYPRGPHGKARLESNASRQAAKHRYALTKQDALDMNLHLCSFAPAVPQQVCKAAFMALWDTLSYDWSSPWKEVTIRILDGRHATNVAGGTEQLAAATCATPGSPNTTQNQGATSANNSPVNSSQSGGNKPSVLAYTGWSPFGLVGSGVAALLAGAVALRTSRASTSNASGTAASTART